MHLNFRYIFFIAAARSEHVAPLPSADRSFLQGQSVVQEGRQERALLNQRTRNVEDLTNEIQKLRDAKVTKQEAYFAEYMRLEEVIETVESIRNAQSSAAASR